MSLWQEKMFSLSSCQFTNPVGIFSSPPQTGERNKGFTGKKYFCNLAAHVSDVCPPSTTHIYVRRGAKQNFSEQEKLFSAECRLCVFDHLTEVKSWSGQSCVGPHFLLHVSKSNVWNQCFYLPFFLLTKLMGIL